MGSPPLQAHTFLCCSPSVLGAAEFLCSYVMGCWWLCLKNVFSSWRGVRNPVLELLGHCSQGCWPGQRFRAVGLQKEAAGHLVPFTPHLSRSPCPPHSTTGRLHAGDLGMQTRDEGERRRCGAVHPGAVPRGNAAAVGPGRGELPLRKIPAQSLPPGERERGVPGRDGPGGTTTTREGSGDVKMQHHPPAPADPPRVCVRREGRREGREGGGQRRFAAGGAARRPPGEAGLGSERALQSRQRSRCNARAAAARGGPPAGGGSCSLATGREEGKKSEGKKKKERSKDPPPPCSARSLPHTLHTIAHTHPIDQYLAVLLQLAAVF